MINIAQKFTLPLLAAITLILLFLIGFVSDENKELASINNIPNPNQVVSQEAVNKTMEEPEEIFSFRGEIVSIATTEIEVRPYQTFKDLSNVKGNIKIQIQDLRNNLAL